jgi:hypothetical protein
MLQTLNALGESPEADSGMQLRNKTHELDVLQENIEKIDTDLTDLLGTLSGRPAALEVLLQERRDLLEQVHARNRAVTKKIEVIKSLLVEEIRQSKTGQTALQGYRQGGEQQQGKSLFRRAL